MSKNNLIVQLTGLQYNLNALEKDPEHTKEAATTIMAFLNQIDLALIKKSQEKLRAFVTQYDLIKKLGRSPTNPEITVFWSMLYKIDDDFSKINTYDEFREIIERCSDFTAFCQAQDSDFNRELIKYILA